MSVPFLLSLFFYVTDKRAVTVVRHSKMLDLEFSQWQPHVATPAATEFITNVGIGQKHFGTVRFDFCGLGRGRFGIGRTSLAKEGGVVPYLEITSMRPGESRARIVQIYMGIGTEAEDNIQSAYAALADEPAGG